MRHFLLRVSLCISLMCLGACSDEQTALSASQSQTEQTSTSPTTNPHWPTYLVGTETTYQPFEFKDKKGNAVGFEIDLIHAIAKNQQFNISILPNKRQRAQQLLDSGANHIWVSAFQIGVDIDARYTDSIMEFYRVVAVPETSSIRELKELRGKTLAINENSSEETSHKAANLVGKEGKLHPKDTFILAIHDVLAGESDGVLGDVNMLRYYAKQHDIKWRYIKIDHDKGQIGFTVQKNNAELQAKLNAGLAAIKTDGTYQKILTNWFGNDFTQK